MKTVKITLKSKRNEPVSALQAHFMAARIFRHFALRCNIKLPAVEMLQRHLPNATEVIELNGSQAVVKMVVSNEFENYLKDLGIVKK